MIKELLNQVKFFRVLQEKQVGPQYVVIGQPVDLKKWLAFITLVLSQQPKKDCFFSKIYTLQDAKLAAAWQIVLTDVDAFKEIVDGYLNKPQWLRDYKIVEGVGEAAGDAIMTLVGEPFDPPDPKNIIGSGSGR